MLTPKEVSERAFAKTVMGGYNMAMVDEFLDELTKDYTSVYTENIALKAKLKVLIDKLKEYRETEDSMRAAMLSAQRIADTMVKEAEDKKRVILDSAEAEARRRTNALDKVAEETQKKIGELRREGAVFANDVRELCKRQMELMDEMMTGLEGVSATPEPEEQVEPDAEATEVQKSILDFVKFLNANQKDTQTLSTEEKAPEEGPTEEPETAAQPETGDGPPQD